MDIATYCQDCGEKLKDNANFCEACGKKLKKSDEQPIEKIEPVENEEIEEEPIEPEKTLKEREKKLKEQIEQEFREKEELKKKEKEKKYLKRKEKEIRKEKKKEFGVYITKKDFAIYFIYAVILSLIFLLTTLFASFLIKPDLTGLGTAFPWYDFNLGVPLQWMTAHYTGTNKNPVQNLNVSSYTNLIINFFVIMIIFVAIGYAYKRFK